MEDTVLHSKALWLKSKILTVKPEVCKAIVDRKGRQEGKSEVLTNWEFSSNACQHLKVLEELLLSPGTHSQPQALVLNAEWFERKH